MIITQNKNRITKSGIKQSALKILTDHDDDNLYNRQKCPLSKNVTITLLM